MSRVLLFYPCSTLSCSTQTDPLSGTGHARVMENKPPFPAPSHPNRPTSLMHPFPLSKSSPPKRDATRILTPHYNRAVPPPHDVFDTGLLTPQASQNAVDSDAAKSLISPPPEDSAPAGSSRQSVRFNLRDLAFTHCRSLTPVLMDQSWFGACFDFTSCCEHR